MKFLSALIAASVTVLFSYGFVFAQAGGVDLEEKYREIYGSVEVAIPALGGNTLRSSGSAFLLDAARRLFITANHVIPSMYPALRESYMKVNDIVAKYICAWPQADLAILQTEDLPEGMREAKLALPKERDSIYASIGGAITGIAEVYHVRPGEFKQLVTRGGTDYRSRVNRVFEGFLHDGSDKGIPTGAVFFSTDSDTRTGFSGGPFMNHSGEVIGVVISGAGGIGYASSAHNIATLLKKCEQAFKENGL